MKKVKIEEVERLEMISIRLENLKIPKEKKNPIILDMEWLIWKLREAYRIIEQD